MTNFEKIRNMNHGQLAEFLDTLTAACINRKTYDDCKQCPVYYAGMPKGGCDEEEIQIWLNKEQEDI